VAVPVAVLVRVDVAEDVAVPVAVGGTDVALAVTVRVAV
jgi:hypothetical protein